MKKLMTLALGLSLVLGTISVPAQAANKKISRTSKRGKRTNKVKRAKRATKKTIV